MAIPTPSSVRQNYHPDCEAAINDQINLEFHASYVYLSMAFYFDRDDVALRYFSQYFLQQSNKESENAEKLMWVQNQRGGLIRLFNIRRPEHENWESGLRAMEYALHLTKQMNENLLNLYHLGTEKKDAHVCNFLKRHYLHEKVQFIKELGDHITNLRKMGAPEFRLAEHIFDKLTLGGNKN
ncbi:ferritin heavy chain-like [Molossus nigricans]|uniref:ferritin heavy chain-like n=1 Tax=Molossus molossus TaxID=27622 RepID=UPI00174632BC|nr:ferritin heavy chain-like [Molossus molossus]